MPEDGQSSRKSSFTSHVGTYLKPCFSFFLSGAVKVVALIDIFMSLCCVIYITILLWKLVDNSYTQFQTDSQPTRIGFWAWYLTQLSVTIILAGFLFHSATYRNIRRCQIWIIISVPLFVIWTIVFVTHLALSSLPITLICLFSTFGIYRAYTFFAVFAFINETGHETGYHSPVQCLSDEEVEDFFAGDPVEAMKNYDNGMLSEHWPYDQAYEIQKDNLYIDTQNRIGKGRHGLILKGNRKLTDGTFAPVVVNTTDPNETDLSDFKTILAELKILIYVGEHANIVNLIGACTENIRDRNLLIVVDYCPKGSLQEYLKARRGFFVNLVRKGNICPNSIIKQYCNVEATMSSEIITTIHLLRWSYEVSCGLAFLASKKVIHGNLSAGNVLLTYEKVAKISDFGRLKPLVPSDTDSSDSKIEEVPWRWLALESLIDSKFSTQSDIWSLGVTMWEIFSLAEVPYPGLSWSPDFVDYISRGMRMNKPAYATNDLYNLLLECWDNAPENRPSLDRITTTLENYLQKCQAKDIMTSGYVKQFSEPTLAKEADEG